MRFYRQCERDKLSQPCLLNSTLPCLPLPLPPIPLIPPPPLSRALRALAVYMKEGPSHGCYIPWAAPTSFASGPFKTYHGRELQGRLKGKGEGVFLPRPLLSELHGQNLTSFSAHDSNQFRPIFRILQRANTVLYALFRVRKRGLASSLVSVGGTKRPAEAAPRGPSSPASQIKASSTPAAVISYPRCGSLFILRAIFPLVSGTK